MVVDITDLLEEFLLIDSENGPCKLKIPKNRC